MLDRNVKVAIPCPKCEQKVEETIARLEANPTLTCPACNATITIQAEKLRQGLQEVEQSLAKLKKKTVINLKLKF
jgi:uncharacterized paraquat-inducible protein A